MNKYEKAKKLDFLASYYKLRNEENYGDLNGKERRALDKEIKNLEKDLGYRK